MKRLHNKERVFICGGTGFIGKCLAEKLLEQGRKIDLLVHDRVPEGLEDWKRAINIHQGDILDIKTLDKAMKDTTVVVNLVGSSTKDLYALNILANFNLLETAVRTGVKKIVFISSQAVYGECPGEPSRESDKPRPKTEYGLVKHLAESMYKHYWDTYKLSCTILRLSNVYGRGQRAGVIHNFISAILRNEPVNIYNNGTQKRDFLHIDDAVDGMVKALDYTKKNFEIFNISGPEPRTILEALAIIEKAMQRKSQIRFMETKEADISCLWSSYEKAEAVLNYSPQIPLEEGIPRTIQSFLAKG